MQITTDVSDEILEMRLAGRLDNDSAGDLTAAIEEAMRLGRHSIVVHLTDVHYVSSAGLGALVRAYKQFQAVRGFFGVATASPSVAEVLRLTNLANLLMCDVNSIRRSVPGLKATTMPTFRIAAPAGMQFELYDLEGDAHLECRVFGQPARLGAGFAAADCQTVDFPADTIGVGLAAFGPDFANCAPRFGEFLAVAGAAAQHPTQGADKPDFQMATSDFVPQAQMLYGLTCSGAPAQMIRFEPSDASRRIPFSALVEQCLAQVSAPQAAMVFLAESAGLVGARLRRSPAVVDDTNGSRLAHPEIRRWLSFSPERVHLHTLALIVGVASREPPTGEVAALAPLLRPLRPGGGLQGHFHAAVFSYRPFKKRKLDLHETVAALFESEDLQAVVHLLNDDREISGGGESEFVSGACWLGPIERVVAGEAVRT